MIQVTDQYYIDVSVNPVVYTVKKKIVRRNKRDGGEDEDFYVLGYLGTVGGALKFIDEILPLQPSRSSLDNSQMPSHGFQMDASNCGAQLTPHYQKGG